MTMALQNDARLPPPVAHLTERLMYFQENDILCDLKLMAGTTGPRRVHQCVLAAHSLMFSNIVTNKNLPITKYDLCSRLNVYLSNVELDLLIKYLYTGSTLSWTTKTVDCFVKIAQFNKMDALIISCKEFLTSKEIPASLALCEDSLDVSDENSRSEKSIFSKGKERSHQDKNVSEIKKAGMQLVVQKLGRKVIVKVCESMTLSSSQESPSTKLSPAKFPLVTTRAVANYPKNNTTTCSGDARTQPRQCVAADNSQTINKTSAISKNAAFQCGGTCNSETVDSDIVLPEITSSNAAHKALFTTETAFKSKEKGLESEAVLLEQSRANFEVTGSGDEDANDDTTTICHSRSNQHQEVDLSHKSTEADINVTVSGRIVGSVPRYSCQQLACYNVLLDNVIKCAICGVKFSSKGLLWSHHLNKHGSAAMTCEGCGLDYSGSFYNFKKHPLHVPVNTIWEELICTWCGKDFNNDLAGLWEHHVTEHEDKQIQCNMCMSVFDTEEDFFSHNPRTYFEREKSHRWTCPECAFFAYGDQQKIVIHWRRLHETGNIYRCDKCTETPFETVRLEEFAEHKLRSHGIFDRQGIYKYINVYTCDACDFKTYSQSEACVHVNTLKCTVKFSDGFSDVKIFEASKFNHRSIQKVCMTNSSTYACDVCNFVAVTITKLVNHKIANHGMVPEGPTAHKCLHCEYSSFIPSVLANHFARDHKDKHGTTKSDVQRLPRYICSICSRVFSRKPEYQEHFESHGVSKCLMCSAVYENQRKLKRHMRSKHRPIKTSVASQSRELAEGQSLVGRPGLRRRRPGKLKTPGSGVLKDIGSLETAEKTQSRIKSVRVDSAVKFARLSRKRKAVLVSPSPEKGKLTSLCVDSGVKFERLSRKRKAVIVSPSPEKGKLGGSEFSHEPSKPNDVASFREKQQSSEFAKLISLKGLVESEEQRNPLRHRKQPKIVVVNLADLLQNRKDNSSSVTATQSQGYPTTPQSKFAPHTTDIYNSQLEAGSVRCRDNINPTIICRAPLGSPEMTAIFARKTSEELKKSVVQTTTRRIDLKEPRTKSNTSKKRNRRKYPPASS